MILLDDHSPPRMRLNPGDVVLVHKLVKNPRDGGAPFMWKWLGTVVAHKGMRVRCIRFGADAGKDEITLDLRVISEEQQVWFLPEEQWPDGVYAFRTRLILEGRIDGAMFGA